MRVLPRRLGGLALLALLGPGTPALAQPSELTIQDIFGPEKKVDFGHPLTGLRWLDDTHYHQARTDPDTHFSEHLRVEARTGRAEPLFDASALAAALRREAGIGDEEAQRLAHQPSYVMNDAGNALIVT